MTSRDINQRFKEHCYRKNRFISTNIRSDGKSHYSISKLDEFYTEKEALDFETYSIINEKAINPNGYNLRCDGKFAEFVLCELAGQLKFDII